MKILTRNFGTSWRHRFADSGGNYHIRSGIVASL